MKLSNELYNALKWLALVGLPAIASLYFGIATVWGLPYTDKIVGTMTLIDTALGIMLHISFIQFNRVNNMAIIPRPGAMKPPE